LRATISTEKLSQRFAPTNHSVYWAVTEHVRTWLSEDGPYSQAIANSGGIIAGDQVRAIAYIYKVVRGITKGPATAQGIADALNDYNGHWSKNLSERAAQCEELAKLLKERGLTKNLFVSGVTKLSWFVQPKDWTVFDSFVTNAMDVKGNTSISKMRHFYDELVARDFLKTSVEIQRILQNSPLRQLHAPRVLDKLMMFRGGGEDWAQQTIRINANFLDMLPKDWREIIHNLATKTQRTIGNDILIKQ